jgi:hypothetical protein
MYLGDVTIRAVRRIVQRIFMLRLILYCYILIPLHAATILGGTGGFACHRRL